MMIDEKENNLFECPLSFLLKGAAGQELKKGKAKARIEKEKLSLFTDSGGTLKYPLREIVQIDEKEYHIFLTLSVNERVELFNIGYKFEDFFRELSKFWNELILQDMLTKDKIRKKDTQAEYACLNSNGEKERGGKCFLRIYETTFVIIPLQGGIIRIPLSNFNDTQSDDYSVTLIMDSNEKIIVSKMGYETDPFKKVLSDTLNNLSMKTQTFLQELLVDTDSETIRALSHLMKEGKVVCRKAIESISVKLWGDMEKRIAETPLVDEYEYLKTIGVAERIAIGFKRGLMGSMGGDYLFLLVPVYGGKPGEPGNAVALEAGVIRTREKDPDEPGENENPGEPEPNELDPGETEILKQEGKATYLFRIVGRATFAGFKDITELDRQFDEFIVSFNRSMQEVNFRREPIYLPEKRLDEPKYIKYRYAVIRLPELRKLRSLFIGRVIHKTPEQWQNDMTAVLTFNTQSRDDGEKWEKGG